MADTFFYRRDFVTAQRQYRYTKIEHMDENVGAVGWTISAQDRERLDEVSSGGNRVLD